MTTALENVTDLDQLTEVKRFFVYGSLEVGDRIQAMVAARFPGTFYGFITDRRSSTGRHSHSAYSIRFWKDILARFEPGDFVFMTQGGNPEFEAGMMAQGIRFAQPFNLVSVYQTYETPTFLRFCRTCLGAGAGIALDVGGNTGLTGAMLASYCRHVYIFEGNPALGQAIADTTAGCGNVTILLQAVARASGQLTLYPAGTNNMSAVARDRSDPLVVPCVALDDFCREHGLVPAVLKIDVEGVDAEVILGAARTIEAHRPPIFFEHPLVNADAYDTDLAVARESLSFLERFYHLAAYPALDQLLPVEALGAPLAGFHERYGCLPVNVAALPRS
jgi:FkbM family methyltransferase